VKLTAIDPCKYNQSSGITRMQKLGAKLRGPGEKNPQNGVQCQSTT